MLDLDLDPECRHVDQSPTCRHSNTARHDVDNGSFLLFYFGKTIKGKDDLHLDEMTGAYR